MLAELPLQEYLATLDRCAEDLLWEAGVGAPPIDAFRVAQRLGIAVVSDARMLTRARFARLASESPCGVVETIALAPECREERRHFAVAHEVGEAHAVRVYQMLGVEPAEAGPRAREAIANALAGRLLAPRRWLVGVWRESGGDLLEVKSVFATASHELLARRLLECVPASMVVTITDNGRVAWRGWNLPGPAPPRSPTEIECQRQAQQEERPVWFDDVPSRAARRIACVRCWPVYEPGWRREITIGLLEAEEPVWL
ncbi:hypothetical protein [Botrimarina sp.]|uniref:hypothetical protein n=1 Tax=Botrimarina sp. TaxID=2795802 RepID=UPI0032EFDF52